MERLSRAYETVKKTLINTRKRLSPAPVFNEPQVITGAVGMGPVLVYESVRSALVNPQSRLDKGEYLIRGLPEPTEPILTPGDINPYAYEALQTTGDILWGYNISYFTYGALTYCELLARRRMPEKIKAGISAGAGMAVIIAAETGLMHSMITVDGNAVFVIGTITQDFKDILGGAIGPAFWLGLNHLGNRMRHFDTPK